MKQRSEFKEGNTFATQRAPGLNLKPTEPSLYVVGVHWSPLQRPVLNN